MKMADKFRVKPGTKVDLSKRDPARTPGFKNKSDAKKALKKQVERLSELQYLLYAEDKRALLIVLQAMDAGGKDGTIRHVVGPINPQGCRVTSFKVPSEEERDHDFLWRIHKAVPRMGEIGIFNRSHYEDVLVVRVHNLVPESVWSKRYDIINSFEQNLAENGVTILKFFLHISKEEQRERFQARLDEPTKRWKFSMGDLEERRHWDDYMAAFEAALSRCSTEWAPWFVIPADKKWYRNLAVSSILVETLEGLDMQFPKPTVDVGEVVIDD